MLLWSHHTLGLLCTCGRQKRTQPSLLTSEHKRVHSPLWGGIHCHYKDFYSFTLISACNNWLQKRRFELLLVSSSVFEALQPAIPTTHLLQTCSQGVAQSAASNLLCCSCESPRDRSCPVVQHSGSPAGTCIPLLLYPVLLQRPASRTGITSQQSTRWKPPSLHELAHCSLCMSLTLNAHISPRWLYMLSERVSQLIVACVWVQQGQRHRGGVRPVPECQKLKMLP